MPKSNHAAFVVFLDAGLRSTLGELMATNARRLLRRFQHGWRDIRYVVVPWESDAAASYRVALRAFVGAALKPVTPTAK